MEYKIIMFSKAQGTLIITHFERNNPLFLYLEARKLAGKLVTKQCALCTAENFNIIYKPEFKC